MLKVFTIYGGYSDMSWMKPLNIELASSLEKADIVLFTGGADIAPSFYGESAGSHTSCYPQRDKDEKKLYDEAKALNKLFVGQCRGTQFLCAMAGGKLIQHVTSHAGSTHPVTCTDGDEYVINSIHHQMQFPFTLPETDYKILSWSTGISKKYLGQDDEDLVLPKNFVEPEAVHYKNIQALGFQGHPEWMQENTYGLYKCRIFLKAFLEETLKIELPEIPNVRQKIALALS